MAAYQIERWCGRFQVANTRASTLTDPSIVAALAVRLIGWFASSPDEDASVSSLGGGRG